MKNDLLMFWSDDAAVSLVIWALMAMFALYLGRKQAHQVFYSTGRVLRRTARLWGFSLAALEKNVSTRNKAVLLAHGARESEQAIEREFTRIHDIVRRDLSQYPALHRQIGDVIDKIETDYQKAADAAPLPPAWKDVVETITAIPASGDPAINKVLGNIKTAVDSAHQKTLKAYNQASSQRHKLLGEMQGDWRKVQATMDEVNHKVNGLEERSRVIDSQIKNYQSIRRACDTAADSLATSAMTQFFVSGLVLVVALLGGLINFQLIAMPMSEMVGGASYIGTMKTSDIAALVIILIEIAMGLFLMESLRITHLFPMIGTMDDKMRKRMMWVTFSILTILATIEASLAYMRDLLALDREALNQALSGAGVAGGAVQAHFRWIPSLGQMVMGFILPFALAFIAIPLESFIHSLRVVLGTLLVGILKIARVTVRIVGGAAAHLMLLGRHLYDLLIVLPLGVERLLKAVLAQRRQAAEQSSHADSVEAEVAPDAGFDLANPGEIEAKPSRTSPRPSKRKRSRTDEELTDINLADTLA